MDIQDIKAFKHKTIEEFDKLIEVSKKLTSLIDNNFENNSMSEAFNSMVHNVANRIKDFASLTQSTELNSVADNLLNKSVSYDIFTPNDLQSTMQEFESQLDTLISANENEQANQNHTQEIDEQSLQVITDKFIQSKILYDYFEAAQSYKDNKPRTKMPSSLINSSEYVASGITRENYDQRLKEFTNLKPILEQKIKETLSARLTDFQGKKADSFESSEAYVQEGIDSCAESLAASLAYIDDCDKYRESIEVDNKEYLGNFEMEQAVIFVEHFADYVKTINTLSAEISNLKQSYPNNKTIDSLCNQIADLGVKEQFNKMYSNNSISFEPTQIKAYLMELNEKLDKIKTSYFEFMNDNKKEQGQKDDAIEVSFGDDKKIDEEATTEQVSETIENDYGQEAEVNNIEAVGSEKAVAEDAVVEPKPKANEQTLRQKFDIDNEEEFNRLLAHYAQVNKSYYSGDGKKKSEEEVKKRKNINAQFKRVLQKKSEQLPQNENGEDFSATITSIEKGEVFAYSELKEVAENKGATLKLFSIMASGVYEKDGKKIRLTQKQRVALASTLEIVSGMRLDMDNAKKQNKAPVANVNENTKVATLGDE